MTTIIPRTLVRSAIAAGALSLMSAPVSAVNIPEGGAVTPDSVFVINFQVQEGCDGAPTDVLEVTVPDVVTNPLPEDVPGWDVEVTTEVADASEGDSTDEDDAVLTVIRWTGGPLEEGAFAEFGLRARFPDDPGAVIAFPVRQQCGTLERAFAEGDSQNPAPTVTLTERFGPSDIADLSDAVAQMQAEIEELADQIGSVDAPNLRSRVSDSEDAVQDFDSRLKDLENQLQSLEDSQPEQ